MFLLLSLCRYLCWRTISLRGYHPHISQYFDLNGLLESSFYYYHWVDTSVGGLLVPEGIIHPVVSVLALTWFIRYLCFYYYHWVDTSAGGLLVSEGIIHTLVSILTLSVQKVIPLYFISMFLLLSLCRYLCWWTISPEGIIHH